MKNATATIKDNVKRMFVNMILSVNFFRICIMSNEYIKEFIYIEYVEFIK